MNEKKSKTRLRLEYYFRRVITLFYQLLCNPIAIKGYFMEDGLHIVNNNFGDDINIPIIEAISGRKVVLWRNCVHWENTENIIAIGSILEYDIDEKTIVWGSGAMMGDIKLKHRPKKVCSVRGYLSQEYLQNQGIDCPSVFGDPALLLPYIYKSDTKKKFKYGIVPHIVDYELPHVKKFRSQNSEVLFIKLQGYRKWQDIVDQINSCEIIISSSLHGLIVSDAYGIPNVRVVFSDLIKGGDFKFLDYFSSVNRDFQNPIDFRLHINLEKVEELVGKYQHITYDPSNLIKAFPYSLTREFTSILNRNIIF